MYEYIPEKSKSIVGKDGREVCIQVVRDRSWGKLFQVDLCHHRCSCGQFQENGYPCVHALYILHREKKYDQVVSYIDEGYRTERVAETCVNLPPNWKDRVHGFGMQQYHHLYEESCGKRSGIRFELWSSPEKKSYQPQYDDEMRNRYVRANPAGKKVNEVPCTQGVEYLEDDLDFSRKRKEPRERSSRSCYNYFIVCSSQFEGMM